MKAGAREYRIRGNRATLRTMKPEDVTDSYVQWLNDPEVSRFLSIRESSQDIDSVLRYVRDYLESDTKVMLGIFLNEGDRHIGNVTFSTIDDERGIGTLGISIGDKSLWNRGYAVEALELTKRLAFGHMGLHCLQAGANPENEASVRLFQRTGFRIEQADSGERETGGPRFGAPPFILLKEELPPQRRDREQEQD